MLEVPHKTAAGRGAKDGTGSVPTTLAATLACLYEATAPKPGNVHPGASFDDETTYTQFVSSAVVVGPILARTQSRGMGRTVLDAVRATRKAVGTNTNLGTLLLLAPLAAVPREQRLEAAIQSVLGRFTPEDTRLVYEAIRLSGAGGLGRAQQADVLADVPADLTLVEAMRLAAERDLVARQYVNGFVEAFRGAAWIAEGLAQSWSLSVAIVHAHVRQMAACGDSLIGRKCGPDLADEARQRAARVLDAGRPGEPAYEKAVIDLDGWLRADGHRRNPGTTADLIAAALFVLLREGRVDWLQVRWA